jgi:hypothetical protein
MSSLGGKTPPPPPLSAKNAFQGPLPHAIFTFAAEESGEFGLVFPQENCREVLLHIRAKVKIPRLQIAIRNQKLRIQIAPLRANQRSCLPLNVTSASGL